MSSHRSPQLAVTTETDLGIATPLAAVGDGVDAEEDDPPPQAANCNASSIAASAVRDDFIN
jgi:hypothetical protein